MSALSKAIPAALELTQPVSARQAYLLDNDALRFVANLCERFDDRRMQLLQQRIQRQIGFDQGATPDFDPTTQAIRDSDFKVAAIPDEVADRRTEITGPVSRKMVINALNAGAQVFMADFEDSSSPTWQNMIDGQHNLLDANRRQIDFTADNGKRYELSESPAVLMVRPRGLHLPEANVLLNGKPIPGCLLDFGLYLYHNHQALLQRGSRPYFYLPKLEHYEEAAWWADVIACAEQALGLSTGTVRVTVLIETLPAVFQMDEILYQLRDYILGLNCGRWDYIFSYIKTFRNHSNKLLPDREQVGMTSPFLQAYSQLLIKTCHRRGAFAMGGMAAQIPIKNDPEANQQAMQRVLADKQREASAGHDGTWVAHPALEAMARQEFDAVLSGPNQIDRQLDINISTAQLLEPATGSITVTGVTGNIRVALQYLHAWINGNGCVPINHLMEDAATAEIARAQLWQWRSSHAKTECGQVIDDAFLQRIFDQQLQALLQNTVSQHQPSLHKAAELLRWLVFSDQLEPFLTLPAYQLLDHS